MSIASLAFGTPSPIPTPPAAGKKLFLGADGKLRTIAPDGTVDIVGGTGVVDWADIQNKPLVFPPEDHLAAKITDFVDAANDAITELDAGTY
jgi:hypothetical protein